MMLAQSGDVNYFNVCETLIAKRQSTLVVGQLMYCDKFLEFIFKWF